MMKHGKMVVVSAPSGAGKTTIVRRLLASGLNLEFSISACSRQPRANEKNGVDYYFISEGEFRKRIKRSEFVQVFVKHTSAAITINENADPTVLTDMEEYFDRLAPEDQDYFEHTLEGPDDMPAHIKTTLIGHSVSIPITNGRLNLGTWQGIYLCEFRSRAQARKLIITVVGE
jgi:secondary thiamine-phosphate synthase enzyme